jgi:hypothetical protein
MATNTAPRIPVVNGASVPLPSYTFVNMPLGFKVCDETGQYWRLSLATEAIDHAATEAVGGNPHMRWLAVANMDTRPTAEVPSPVTEAPEETP